MIQEELNIFEQEEREYTSIHIFNDKVIGFTEEEVRTMKPKVLYDCANKYEVVWPNGVIFLFSGTSGSVKDKFNGYVMTFYKNKYKSHYLDIRIEEDFKWLLNQKINNYHQYSFNEGEQEGDWIKW